LYNKENEIALGDRIAQRHKFAQRKRKKSGPKDLAVNSEKIVEKN
jgi:hypothetical protein